MNSKKKNKYLGSLLKLLSDGLPNWIQFIKEQTWVD